jgi:DNA-binding PadR family transcriptional regulator
MTRPMARHSTPFPRLSAKEALILDLLRSGEMYGLELVTASDGALKRGTVYVTLGRMEDKGLILSRIGDEAPALGGLPRRLYKPTAFGKQLLSATLSLRRRLMPRFAR